MGAAASVSSIGASLDSFKLRSSQNGRVDKEVGCFFAETPIATRSTQRSDFFAKTKNRAVLTLSRKNHFADLFPCIIKYVLDLPYLLVIKVRVVGKDRAGNFPDAPADPGK